MTVYSVFALSIVKPACQSGINVPTLPYISKFRESVWKTVCMVPCIIIIISYIKHQNNYLSKFSRNTTLLFYHNNYYVSSTDCTRDFYYFVLKTNITLLFPTNKSLPLPFCVFRHNMLFTVSVGLMLMTPGQTFETQ